LLPLVLTLEKHSASAAWQLKNGETNKSNRDLTTSKFFSPKLHRAEKKISIEVIVKTFEDVYASPLTGYIAQCSEAIKTA
jgi:hypothetical protein